jgi:DNA-binding CsgD family transcriptional regulator
MDLGGGKVPGESIVGRDVEVRQIWQSVSDVAAGRGGAVWVAGEPGIGKSTLVNVGVRGAEAYGVRVLRGVADELTQSFALRLMADCLGIDRSPVDRFRLEISDLLAGRIGEVNAVRAASERMVALVERECARSPVVLVGDDLQWADEASLDVWHRLAEVAGQAPLLLVGACRPVPQRVVVDRVRQAVAKAPDAVVVELGPLGSVDVSAMAEALLSVAPGPDLQKSLNQAGGNPLYVREMVDALVGAGLVRVVGGVADVAGSAMPDLSSLNAAIGRRLGFLSVDARLVLRAGTVLGGRFTVDDLAVVSDQPVAGLARIVDEAVAAGVLADAGSYLTFRHALIRQVLYDEMPTAVSIGLHGHVARALADAGAPWDRVAQHLLAAPQTIDGWALTWLASLPAAALYALPAIAADLLERARQVSAPGDPRWALFTTQLTALLQLLRRSHDLVELGVGALAMVTEPRLVGEIAWNLAWGYLMAGRNDDGDMMITRVLDGPDPGAPWRSRLRAERALLLLSGGHAEESAAQAQQAIAEAERDGDPVTVGWALNALLRRASDADALEIIDRALKVLVGEDPESMDLRLLFLTERLLVLSNLDRSAEFDAALTPTIALAESQGSQHLVQAERAAANCLLGRGDWDQALLHLGHTAHVLTPHQSLHRSGTAALIAIRRGDTATARRHITAVADIPYLRSVVLFLGAQNLNVARALLAEAQGDLTTAVEILAGWLEPRFVGNAHACARRAEILPELVRLALAAGDRGTARAAVAAIELDAHDNADVKLTTRAGMCRAMIEDDPQPLLAAADYLDEIGRRPEVAFALHEAAVRQAMRGDIFAGRAAFGRAAAIYEDLGAVLDLRRMQARLRTYGIRRGSHAAHRRIATGWEALTATERAVAAILAEGAANPDIAARLLVSPRTIATHVAHILTKLQARSRLDIVGEVTRHRNTNPDP